MRTLSLIRCLENYPGLINHRITPLTAYCGITVYLFRVSNVLIAVCSLVIGTITVV